jgi:hypothetical protein
LQPPSAAQASHSAKVTANFPAANGRANVTRCCGPSRSTSGSCGNFAKMARPGSLGGEPIMKEPAGTTTISGHVSHSRKVSLGLSARSCSADSDCAWGDAMQQRGCRSGHDKSN